jgi:uncharacterized caspase-like protein
MSRDALVVGIGSYERLRSLAAPPEDAEAIAQLLAQYGDFKIQRLPEAVDGNTIRVGRTLRVSAKDLKRALVQLFKPTGAEIPETGLLFFSGHGLRDELGVYEGFLATSDVDLDKNSWGISLKWLRELLQSSPVREQIVWLDCCYSGELFNFQQTLDQANPGAQDTYNRCFITASRSFEEAFEQISGNHSVLTGTLLQGLNPTQQSDGWVTNRTLSQFIDHHLTHAKTETQRPQFYNSGNPIVLTRNQQLRLKKKQSDQCPYQDLRYFDLVDADFFFGRTALTSKLVDKIRTSNFLSVLGASGSGKSSVVRAGLLYKFKLGQTISGSDRWEYYNPITPGQHPLQRLEQEVGMSAEAWADHLLKTTAERVVLVVDQFEECFTLCHNLEERQQFFSALLETLEQADSKLCLVLVMRADFLGQCAEYPRLAAKLRQLESIELVPPMNRQELTEAIVEPAQKVGLTVEPNLVTQIIEDVEKAPGSLPLMEFALTKLWETRKEPYLDSLTLFAYNQELGGLKGTLEKHANRVYESLAGISPSAQQVAQHIFLELTQLGEGTEDTRRRVRKTDLMVVKQSPELVETVLQKLTEAKLVVTDEQQQGTEKVAIVDVTHEILIRHWKLLRTWLDENRIALIKKRHIEEEAKEWENSAKPREPAYLLQGKKLEEVELFQRTYVHTLPLSLLTREFIQVSKAVARKHKFINGGLITSVAGVMIAIAILGTNVLQDLKVKDIINKIQNGTEVSRDDLNIILKKANTAKEEADKEYKKAGKVTDDFISKLYTNTWRGGQHVNQALYYYKFTIRGFNQKKNQDRSQINIEDNFAAVINRYRLPMLELELRQGKIGNPKYSAQAPDNRFTALQTTYNILVQDAGLSVDGDGLLINAGEAQQAPFLTLEKIEDYWWKDSKKCRWYDPNSEPGTQDYVDRACLAVKENKDGFNLAFMIFDRKAGQLIDRIKECRCRRNNLCSLKKEGDNE